MADELPRPEDVGGAIWSHDWYSYEGYKTVHVRHLTNLLNEGIVEEDGLSFIEYRDARTLAAVNVTGRLKCSNGVIVEVGFVRLAVQRVQDAKA